MIEQYRYALSNDRTINLSYLIIEQYQVCPIEWQTHTGMSYRMTEQYGYVLSKDRAIQVLPYRMTDQYRYICPIERQRTADTQPLWTGFPGVVVPVNILWSVSYVCPFHSDGCSWRQSVSYRSVSACHECLWSEFSPNPRAR